MQYLRPWIYEDKVSRRWFSSWWPCVVYRTIDGRIPSWHFEQPQKLSPGTYTTYLW